MLIIFAMVTVTVDVYQAGLNHGIDSSDGSIGDGLGPAYTGWDKTLFMAVFVTGVGGNTTAHISYVLKEMIH